MKLQQDINELINDELNTTSKERKFKIIQVHVEEEPEQEKTFTSKVNDGKEQMKQMTSDVNIGESIEKMKDSAIHTIEKVNEKVKNFQEQEEIKEQWDKVTSTTNQLVNETNKLIHKVGESDPVVETVRKIEDAKEKALQSEQLKTGIHKLKKGILSITDSAHTFVNKKLNSDE